MSRIYQGGSSDRRFQSNKQSVGFSPTQVANNQRKLQEEGARKLEDLKTRDRERRRAEDMSNAVSAAQDKVEVSQLQQIQAQERARFELKQKMEGFEVSNDQLIAKNQLALETSRDKGKFNNEQFADKSQLNYSQMLEENTLKQDQLEERLALEMDAGVENANFRVEQAQMQADFATQRAGLQKQQAGITALLKFGEIAVGGAQIYSDWKEEKDQEQQKIDAEAWVFSSDAQVVLPGGEINPVVGAQQQQSSVEVAEEQAIINANPGDPVGQEEIRAPGADATAARNWRQASIGQASQNIRGDLWDVFYNADTRVTLPDGRTIAPTEATGAGELQVVLQSLGGALANKYGIMGGDKYAVVTQFVPGLKAAMNEIRQATLPGIIANVQGERVDAALAAARTVAARGDLQGAWDDASKQYFATGAFGGNRGKANDAAFEDLAKSLTDEQLEAWGDVKKTPTSPAFKDDPKYGELWQNERNRRRDAEWDEHTRTGRENTLLVEEAKATYTQALIDAAGDEQATQLANQQYESTLRGQGTKEANLELVKRANMSDNYNPANFAQLRDQIAAGQYPTTVELDEMLTSGAISPTEYNSLTKIGGTNITSGAFDVETTVGKAEMDAIESQIKSTVAGRLGTVVGDGTLARGQTAAVSTDLIKRYEGAVQGYISTFEQSEGRTPNKGEIAAWSNQWVTSEINARLDGVTYSVTDGLKGYNFLGADTRSNAFPDGKSYQVTNPYTGKTSNNLTDVTITGLDKVRESVDITNDTILTQEEISTNLEGAREGRFTSSLIGKANALGVTPMTLLRSQTQAQGFGDVIMDLPSGGSSSSGSSAEPTDLSSGARYLQSMGFTAKGAAFLAANIMQESSWDGRRSWGGVMNPTTGQMDGTSRNGGLVSWASWANDPARLGVIENYLGKSIDKATHAEQLAAMEWEMKTNPRFQTAYRHFTNPNATERQLREASFTYWGYGHEGVNRFGSYLREAKAAVGIS